MAKNRGWTKKELVRLFELLMERGSPLVSHPGFRKLLDRDENLFTNQIIRDANGNITYRSVDFDIDDMLDEEFWTKIENSFDPELIERNAVVEMLKMADKLGIIEEMEA